MDLLLRITGVLLILLSGIHVFFPKYFHWRDDLKPLSLINRQMMQVHAFFIALVVFAMGLLCLIYPWDLTHTRLGKFICLGLAFFWAIRLFVQLFVYSPRLWRGKKRETAIHLFFIFLWVYCTLVFLFSYIGFNNH